MMRQKYFSLLAWSLIGLLVFSSCEKANFADDDDTPSAPTDANLTLKVVANSTRANEMAWETLNFVVYQKNAKVKAITQHADDKQFGEVSMKLAPGTYQVMVLAHSSKSNPSQSDPTNVKFTNEDGFSDTFGAYTTIEVEEKNQTHEINVERLTAMVRFKTKDVKPKEVKQIRFQYKGGSGAINLETGYGVDASIQSVLLDVPDSLTGKRLQYELYTFPRTDEASLNLQVLVLDENGNRLVYPGMGKEGDRNFVVSVKKNQITECSGYFFTEGSAGNDDDDDSEGDNQDDNQDNEEENVSFVLVVDTNWAGTTTYEY